jgi:signal transduction histidine kinase
VHSIENPRILLIDDTPSIHEDFRKILTPRTGDFDFSASELALFELPAPNLRYEFELDSAYQGQEGVAMVRAGLEAQRPYAMAFVDMRMPPGWDGMATVEKLWQADPRLQVVICTAYSDHPWDEVLERLDVQDRLLIVKKPFDMIEVSQLARSLTAKWTLARRAEAQTRGLEQTLLQLRASESNLRYTSSELESFAHSVSHDLRSPLSRIGSFSRLLAEELAGSEGKAQHYLSRILANVGVGEELIKGLLTLTNIARTQVRLQDLDLEAMAKRLAAELQESSPQRNVSIQVQPGLRARGDLRLLEIALRNLMENAWKYSSRRAHTRIEVGLAQQTSEQQVFFVRDNGCGFDMAEAGQMFQNFNRLHGPDEYPGTGVGLVTVSRIVVKHGGRVWADSVPEAGSTFYFSLPVGARQLAGTAPADTACKN